MIGRNDPCSCGSGKKYKQCCLHKQSEEQTFQVKGRHFFERKYKLTNDMYSFLAQKQGGDWAFDYQNKKPFDPSLGGFRDGLSNMWAYFFHVYDNGLRGIEWFLDERGQRYSGDDREMLERWRVMKPSCYQLVDQYEQGTVIEDIWSKERYRMPYSETMMKLPPWTTSVGMIEPFVENWCIHGVFNWGHPDVAPELKNRIEQLQEEIVLSTGEERSPAEILAGNYPEIIDFCNSINNRNNNLAIDSKDLKEQIYLTREYTCESPELLIKLLLDSGDDYVLAPLTEPVEGLTAISRVEKLDGILGTIPAVQRKRLGLDDIHIYKNFGNIEIAKQEITVHGWQSPQFESVLELLESKWSAAVSLTRVNERSEAYQIPDKSSIKTFNIITEREISDQEFSDYGDLPMLLENFHEVQKKSPAESAEVLVKRMEYEQSRINPKSYHLNYLRIALDLPESPFTGW